MTSSPTEISRTATEGFVGDGTEGLVADGIEELVGNRLLFDPQAAPRIRKPSRAA